MPTLSVKTSTLGLIAGSGDFPVLVADAAKSQGVEKVIAVGFRSQTNPAVAGHVDGLHYVGLGQLGKMIGIFQDAGVTHAVMAGKLQHKLVFKDIRFDMKMLKLIPRLKDRRTDSILGGIAEELQAEGITLVDSTAYLREHMAPEGLWVGNALSEAQQGDIDLGSRVAATLGRLDVGQCVAVKDRAVVALEGVEGTDAMLRRAGKLAGKGIVVVKLAKANQDMRFDVPVVGPATLATMAQIGASVLALEADKTLVLDKETFLRQARKAKIAVLGLKGMP